MHYNLGDRVIWLSGNRLAAFAGTIVAISALKKNPSDVMVGIEFDDISAVTIYSNIKPCYELVPTLISNNNIKADFTSSRFVTNDVVYDIVGKMVSYWMRLDNLSLCNSKLNKDTNEDRGGLKYL